MLLTYLTNCVLAYVVTWAVFRVALLMNSTWDEAYRTNHKFVLGIFGTFSVFAFFMFFGYGMSIFHYILITGLFWAFTSKVEKG
jgi:hypothetical protein